jgi:hypothetical protein
MSDGEGQRKEAYYVALAAMRREKVTFQPIVPEWAFALGLNRRKNWGQEQKNA